MGYLLILSPILLLIMIAFSIVKLHKRIDQLEEQMTTGYSSIIGDLHRRIEALERERRNG